MDWYQWTGIWTKGFNANYTQRNSVPAKGIRL